MQLIPGDIVEISDPDGLAYVQVTHIHPPYPEVVRSLGAMHSARRKDLDDLALAETQIVAMVPIGAAIAAAPDRARRIGNIAVPSAFRPFPTFRMAIRDKAGEIAYWWLWDGDGLQYTTTLAEHEQRYPEREILTIDSLIERIAGLSGYGGQISPSGPA